LHQIHGDICPYRLLYIATAAAWATFVELWEATAHDRGEKNLHALWAFWSDEANFLAPNLYFLYALHGRGNPFGKECLACLWQPTPVG
jgi:hypothetical protein